MSTDIDLTTHAAMAAALYLPPFCTVTGAQFINVFDKNMRLKQVLEATLTFPGATAEGFWREDRRDMAMIAEVDYPIYQQLKAEWREGAQSA